MKRNAMSKNLQQSILRSFGRYIAIVMIIALGSGLFMGLLMTKSDMVATGQAYMDQQNMFDLRLMTSYGWSEEHVDEIALLEGVEAAEAVCYADYIARVGDVESDSVYRFYELPEKLNLPVLNGGRMPENESECLADGFHADDSILGQKVIIQDNNDEDSLESIRVREFTIVGYIATPLYMDMNRGTTAIGSGSLNSYFYIPAGVLELEYIPEIHVALEGESTIYSEAYIDAMDAAADELEPSLRILADSQLKKVRQEAEDAYQEGAQELKDGWKEFEEKKAEVEQELEDAEQQLKDAEQEIADNEQLLIDGEKQLENGRIALQQAEAQLVQGRQQLESVKAATLQQIVDMEIELKAKEDALRAERDSIEAPLPQINGELDSVNGQIPGLLAAMMPIDAQISEVNIKIGFVNSNINSLQNSLNMLNRWDAIDGEVSDWGTRAALESQIAQQQGVLSGLNGELAQLQADRAQYSVPLEQLYARRDELQSQRSQLISRRTQIPLEIAAVHTGYVTVSTLRDTFDDQFVEAEAQLEAGAAQIAAGYAQLERSRQELENGKTELEEAKLEIKDAWVELEEGRLEAEAEFRDAEAELKDAEEELADARELIDSMTENEPMILDRTSNVGYNNLDSSSDIVQGVSRVFPVFFLLVASLVCITTMTRMIDEERTQIGTLKALGYSNGEIIRKYMFYSGSGAIIGCGVGVVVGSSIFPMILWEAYKIMLHIQPNVLLTVNWWLCIAVVAVYTAVLLLVTWYCCRRTLEEVPAELIRPKAPDAGKALLVEKLPFWHKISFLNKVMIRNIFRYRQRLAMMLVGIGGCTALLVTGFGLRDSIVNVVDLQFEEVTTYDMSVYFKEGQTEENKTEFLEDMAGLADNIAFYHQSSVDLVYDNGMKEIYMISGGEEICDFIDMHDGDTPVSLPGINEVVLSVGVAEAMGIDEGDAVILRNSDMEELELTVSDIYDNHVYNYSIVSPETIRLQWDRFPEQQMAFVKVPEGMEVHPVSAEITAMPQVLNVMVSEDLAEMVGSMMDALDLVVIVIVFCAGLLAVIVLYNLTNININERIREIATIKVLGFNASETAAYVFKENMALTVVGAIVGLGLGNLLLAFVMSQIKIDMVWFKTIVMPPSYLWSVLLTMLSAVVVDFIFYFKLQKINMAEALKSVE